MSTNSRVETLQRKICNLDGRPSEEFCQYFSGVLDSLGFPVFTQSDLALISTLEIFFELQQNLSASKN